MVYRLGTRGAYFAVAVCLTLGISVDGVSAPESVDSKPSSPLTTSAPSRPAQASPDRFEEIKAQIAALKAEYEQRLQDLQKQVEALQTQLLQASPEAAVLPAPMPVQSIPGSLNPAISVVGNFVGRADSTKVFGDDGARIDNKLSLREAEVDMRVPIDPYADGVLITSLSAESPGRFSADVEEAYVNIKKLPFMDQPPLGLKLKVGRFRPSFGKFNVLHTHDLPQTFRSLPTTEFLGQEGFVQDGVSASFFIPTPWDKQSSLDATLEFLDGRDIALTGSTGRRNAYLGHLRWFRTIKDSQNLELGWSSYLQPSSDRLGTARLHALDFTYRWKPLRQGEWKSYLFGGEWMIARPSASLGPQDPQCPTANGCVASGHPQGYSVFTQWQFDRRKYAGVRWDHTDTLLNRSQQRKSITPYFSYYFSEFLRFRLNFEHRMSDLALEDGRNSLYMELNWVFGSHPPEPFWVNK